VVSDNTRAVRMRNSAVSKTKERDRISKSQFCN
jgi:hypothetical protein